MCNTSNMTVRDVEGDALLMRLDQDRICASAGSACASGSLDPSHVLEAMGHDGHAARGSIRFSLSRFTTRHEIDTVVERFSNAVEQLRAISA